MSITNNEITQNPKSEQKKFSILCTFNVLTAGGISFLPTIQTSSALLFPIQKIALLLPIHNKICSSASYTTKIGLLLPIQQKLLFCFLHKKRICSSASYTKIIAILSVTLSSWPFIIINCSIRKSLKHFALFTKAYLG